MIDMTGFGYARLKKLNGVHIDISFDPTKLTPRVRNAAQKMLRNKSITGSGQAGKAALMAWSAVTNPPAAMRGDSFVLNYRRLSEPVREEWRRLLTTGRMLALADLDERYSDTMRSYIEGCHEVDMSALDGQAIDHSRPNYYFSTHRFPAEIREQMVAAFKADNTDLGKFELAAQMLDGTARIRPNMELIALTV
jgi:hypothetical protein